jgi:O-antigen/teichoic acid export membrane protein
LSAIVFAAGGVGFAFGNILLARVLPEEEYGRVALFLAITQLGITLGPLGVDTVVNRHHLSASASLLGRVTLTSVVVGLALATVAFLFYGFGAPLAAVLAVTVLAAAVNRVGGSFFQSRQKFRFSLFLILIHNWILLCAVPVVLLSDRPEALPAALTVATGYVLMATIGWRKGLGLRHAHQSSVEHDSASGAVEVPQSGTILREGLAVVGMQVAVAAFFQLDRLLIPNALSIRDLAIYSVVSSVAASPFRMLQTGLGFALLPRVRACTSREAVRRLLRHELIVAFAMATLAAVLVIAVTPWLLSKMLDSRYEFHMSLLYALIVVGFVRVWNGISGATVAALGSARQLAAFNACSWGSLALGAGCAWLARGAGLQGIVYGIGVGWLASALAGTLIGAQAVAKRTDFGAPRPAGSSLDNSGPAAPRSSMN